jgi:chromosome segregation ATPase
MEAFVKPTAISIMLGVLSLAAVPRGFSQAIPPDAQTLQEILAELQSIHKDMRLTTVSQILLVELQTQQTVVNAAAERVNNTRRDLSSLQADEKKTSIALADLQDRPMNTSDPAQVAMLSSTTTNLKSDLAALKVKEDGLITSVQTAESQLRSAQDTLDDVQRRLNETVKKLQPPSGNTN